ncbi:MAG: 2-oxo acid dehydrogenase subunit E2 [SAR324 cluster bacterium]|nr:2-oxo acid dehydrogenase subunit E2 [SAR324 cluster bacterium]
MPGIQLPHLGYATREGTILSWLKAPGDPVRAGEGVVEVAMEKTVHVLVAEVDGVFLAAWAPEGAIVPEGETIGWIGNPGEKPPAGQCRLVGWEPQIAPPPDNLAELIHSASRGAPSAGKIDAEGGAAPGDALDKHRRVLRGQLRRVTAQRMARSWQDAPKVDLFADVDFTRVESHRQALKAAGHEAPSYNIYIAHAVVRAFQDLPSFNYHLIDGEAVALEGIHVGMAVALGDNLVTVSMKDLSGAGLQEIQRRFKGLIRKALRMSLHRDELYGSSLTITSLGEFDVSAFTAVLNPPEIFILAIGKVEERVVVKDGAIAVAPMCTFCLSFDHRAVDGAPASRLLQRIKHHMEAEPGP